MASLHQRCGGIEGGRDDEDENSVALSCAKVSCMSLKVAKRGEWSFDRRFKQYIDPEKDGV